MMYSKQVVHHVKFNQEYAIYSTSVTEFELQINIKIFESEKDSYPKTDF